MIDIENITDELDVISYEEFLKTEEDILFKIRNKAESLMSLNGLYDWKFQFDNAQTRFGFCSHSHNIISISKKIALVVSFEEVVDTILHEIAHALTPCHKHDIIWKTKAKQIGCSGKIYGDVNINKVLSFKGICNKCKREIFAARRRNGLVCVNCLNDEYTLSGSSNYKNYMFEWIRNV